MNITQTNKLNMFEATLTTLQNNQQSWSNIPAFAEAVAEFAAILPQIRSLGAQQVVPSAGITQSKAEKKERMAKQAFTLANIAMAYAAKEKNNELKTVLDFTFSDIHKCKDNISIDRSTAIHNRISAILPQLSSYNITGNDLASLSTAITDFQQAIGDKGTIMSGNVASTQALLRLFEEADTLLKDRLDKLIFRFQDLQPKFFDTYTNARIIRDLGKGRKIAKETVKV